MKGRKRFLLTTILIGSMALSFSVTASEKTTLEEQIEVLESEKAVLEEKVEQLESENAELEARITEMEMGETEKEIETEVVGIEYTDKSIVKIVQKALNDAGYECGTPDGLAGSKTTDAIKAYQKEKGINVNGVITDELLEAMGVMEQVAEAAANEAKMKEYSSEYTYTQIARDANAFLNEKMTFKGKVLQEGDAGSGIRYIRLANNSDYDEVLFITYDEEIVEYRILDDDIITIYGECLGEYTYETVMGSSVTLPWIHADIIDMSDVNM